MNIKTSLFTALSTLFFMTPIAFAAQCGGGGTSKPLSPTDTAAISKVIVERHPEIVKVVTAPTVAATQMTQAQAAKPPLVAKVVWSKGTVKVMGPDKKVREVKADSEINLNDTIITEDGGEVEIVYTDNTIMTFKPKTIFYIDKYEFNEAVKESPKGQYFMDLIEGSYRTITGKIAKADPKSYKVSTEVALMGVRGTDYSASFSACKLLVKRHAGTPFVQNDKGTIELTGKNPFASVPAFDQAPVVLKNEPVEFKVPIKITPATFNLSSKSVSRIEDRIGVLKNGKIETGSGGGDGGGGGSACAPIPGQFSIKFK